MATTKVDVNLIGATGTPSSSVFLRGDGTWNAAGGGKIVQIVNTQTGAVATGTTQSVFDDTIPQNDEGIEFMTLAVTPTSASNKLIIGVRFNGEHTGVGRFNMALFQDTTANALACISSWENTAETFILDLQHYMAAGTTSATTFKVRCGMAGSGTLTFNGDGSARTAGGVLASSITIWEIEV